MTPSVSQLRTLSVVASLFGPQRTRVMRLVTRDGTVHAGSWTRPLYDIVLLGQPGSQPDAEIPLVEIQRVEWRVLHFGRALALASPFVALGALGGAVMQARSAPIEMLAGGGIVLGILAGALAGALVVWLLQNLAWLQRWRVWDIDSVT